MAITTELVLARHGEANNNATGVVGGERGCTGLSPQGREQAHRLALRLTSEHAEHPFGCDRFVWPHHDGLSSRERCNT